MGNEYANKIMVAIMIAIYMFLKVLMNGNTFVLCWNGNTNENYSKE